MKYSPIQAEPKTLGDLFYWIFNELLQLANLFEGIPEEAVAAAYGSMRITSLLQPSDATTTPQKITQWQSAGVAYLFTTDLLAGDITVQSSGVYSISVNVNIGVTSNRGYVVSVYRNGVAVSDGVAIDATNQTTTITAGGTVNLAFAAGDVISLYYKTTASTGNFDIYGATISLNRISGVK